MVPFTFSLLLCEVMLKDLIRIESHHIMGDVSVSCSPVSDGKGYL